MERTFAIRSLNHVEFAATVFFDIFVRFLLQPKLTWLIG